MLYKKNVQFHFRKLHWHLIYLNNNVKKDREILLSFPHEIKELSSGTFFGTPDAYKNNHMYTFKTNVLYIYV